MGKGNSGTKRIKGGAGGSPRKEQGRRRRRRGLDSNEEAQAISPASGADDINAPPNVVLRTRSTTESDLSDLPAPTRRLWISDYSTCLSFGLSYQYEAQGHIMCDTKR